MRKWLWYMTNSAPDRVLINDPKNCSEKSCMLPFPNDLKHFPVCPTFHLATSAKCGLQLNDPIDWFKLRLNQPIIKGAVVHRFNYDTHPFHDIVTQPVFIQFIQWNHLEVWFFVSLQVSGTGLHTSCLWVQFLLFTVWMIHDYDINNYAGYISLNWGQLV